MPYPSERLIWPNFRSPLVWDFFAISTYLTGSLLFLLLPMIPDFALVRDRTTGLRRTDLRRARARLARHDRSSGTASRRRCRSWRSRSFRSPCRCTRSCRSTSRWRRCRCGTRRSSGRTSWRARSSAASPALIIAMAALRKFLHLEDVPAPGSLREPRQAAADDEPALGLLRVRRAARRPGTATSRPRWRCSGRRSAARSRRSTGRWSSATSSSRSSSCRSGGSGRSPAA